MEQLIFTKVKKEFLLQMPRSVTLKDNLSSNSPPSVFVGSKLYPSMNVGILAPPEKLEHAWYLDAPQAWAHENLGISDILQLRNQLINSRFRAKTSDATKSTHFLEIAQQIALADRHVDVEIALKKKIQLGMETDAIAAPLGPRAQLQNVRITSNLHIPQAVEKVFSDTDLKAHDAVQYLQKHEFSEHTLTKILSIGALGMKKNRKLVPTKWAITAVDSMLADTMLDSIKQCQLYPEYALYEGNFLGNHYFILLFPEIWNYELFELYAPGSAWNQQTPVMKASTDYEPFEGRTSYASETAGGFYATRVALTEHLNQKKRQASCLVIRIETPAYTTGLGVWVVREAARRSLQNSPELFPDKESMLLATATKLHTQFTVDAHQIFAKSKLLDSMKHQQKLTAFFT